MCLWFNVICLFRIGNNPGLCVLLFHLTSPSPPTHCCLFLFLLLLLLLSVSGSAINISSNFQIVVVSTSFISTSQFQFDKNFQSAIILSNPLGFVNPHVIRSAPELQRAPSRNAAQCLYFKHLESIDLI